MTISAAGRVMGNVHAYSSVPPKSKLWTRERDKQLLALIDQCGPNLSRAVIAHQLRLGNGERSVSARLRQLGVKGTPL